MFVTTVWISENELRESINIYSSRAEVQQKSSYSPPYDIVKQCPCEPLDPVGDMQAVCSVPGIIRIWHITRTWHHKVLYIGPRNSTYEDTIAVTAVQQYP